MYLFADVILSQPADLRNTRYRAPATAYPGRTSTGWNPPASWRNQATPDYNPKGITAAAFTLKWQLAFAQKRPFWWDMPVKSNVVP
jgi:hypothetical protein